MHRPLPPTSPRRRGFSFTEVLFAVMILGIGFIMVAAIFPVAIQQTATSSEETTAAAVARGGANFLERVATTSYMPATFNVLVGPDYDGLPPMTNADADTDGFSLTTALQGNLVTAADPRMAWVPFYRRAGDPADPTTWSPFAHVVMVPVRVRNDSEFKGGPRVVSDTTGIPGMPVIRGSIVNGNAPGVPDVVTLSTHREVPSEGAYLIIADARRRGNPDWNKRVAPELNGRIYRLGNPLAAQDTNGVATGWELMSGYDFDPVPVDADDDPRTPAAGNGKEFLAGSSPDHLRDIKFFIVGRGHSPADVRVYEGTSQDISAYSTIVGVK